MFEISAKVGTSCMQQQHGKDGKSIKGMEEQVGSFWCQS